MGTAAKNALKKVFSNILQTRGFWSTLLGRRYVEKKDVCLSAKKANFINITIWQTMHMCKVQDRQFVGLGVLN
jgi:hypothetical protein